METESANSCEDELQARVPVSGEFGENRWGVGQGNVVGDQMGRYVATR